MPSLKDFEDLVATSASVSNQFTTTNGGGLAFKGKGGRLQTFFGYQKDANIAMLRSFQEALKAAYGEGAAQDGFRRAGLEARLLTGEPLSVREVTAAIRETKAALIQSENVKYERQYRTLEEEARAWNPTPQVSTVEGSGLRLVQQDQVGFRLHNWNAKNNPDSTDDKSKAAELDELVEKEVAAIKAERLKAATSGAKLEPMSERLMYLQAKLNLTERMVTEACKPENLKEGGPKANIFLGPDMFFSPSNGPKVAGFACEKTTGGAYTEAEMKQITEGLRRISERHPQVTLMPGTIVWSKPAPIVPIIDGLPRPADMAFNNAPVFYKGELTHITYKMTDGGDARWAATGINGPDGNFHTKPSPDNQYKARLQVFLGNDLMNGAIGVDGMEKVRPIVTAMETQASQKSKGREWENGLRRGGADARSSYNTIFTIEDKVIALEICRDHSNGQARKEFARLKNADDPVARLTKAQPDSGANLHVLLFASNKMTPSGTICCTGGVAAQNDVSGGCSISVHIQKRVSQEAVQTTPESKKQMFYKQHDEALRKAKAPELPGLGLSGVDVKRDVPVKPGPILVDLEAMVETTVPERRSSVRDIIKGTPTPTPKAKLVLDQSGTEPPTVRTEARLDKPKTGLPSGPQTVTVKTGL